MAILPFDAHEAKPFTDRLSEGEMDASWQWIEPDGTRRIKTSAAMRLLETHVGTDPVVGRDALKSGVRADLRDL